MKQSIVLTDILSSRPLRIGIIGGGQLGKMMTQAAKTMGFRVVVLDPTPNSPAAQVADEQVIGSFSDPDRIKALVSACDVATYDIEHINTDALKALAAEGHRVEPAPELLEVIQDKLRQKDLLSAHGIPTARYRRVDPARGLEACAAEFGFPLVQKATRGGYDGRGVFVLRSREDLERAIPGDAFLEERIAIEKELAVNVARNHQGEIRCYPVVEMVFDERANICDTIIVPARIPQAKAERAQEIALAVAEALGGVGIFGIELFLSTDGDVLVNEIAPRPHNSGHYTIEACVTSQFEQHIRAVVGLPLGSTRLLTPAVMVNLLGSEGHTGPAVVTGIREALAIEGASLHVYGKEETRPFRKMGHLTIVDADVEWALAKAQRAREALRVATPEAAAEGKQ